MSARARHRRHGFAGSRSARRSCWLSASFLGVLGIAAAVGAGYVYSIMDDAPSIDSLKPLDSGENSVAYDSTGERLGFIDADIVRERVDLKEIEVAPERDDRDRGRELL